LIDFSVGWNGDFFDENLKNFWGFGGQGNFDKSFLGFSWALGQGWVVSGSGSEDLFRRETRKIRFPVTLGHQKPKTKN
jgi:hypothetical protein